MVVHVHTSPAVYPARTGGTCDREQLGSPRLRLLEGLTATIGWRIFSALDATKSGIPAGGEESSDLVKLLAGSPDEPIQQMEEVCSFRAARARAV